MTDFGNGGSWIWRPLAVILYIRCDTLNTELTNSFYVFIIRPPLL